MTPTCLTLWSVLSSGVACAGFVARRCRNHHKIYVRCHPRKCSSVHAAHSTQQCTNILSAHANIPVVLVEQSRQHQQTPLAARESPRYGRMLDDGRYEGSGALPLISPSKQGSEMKQKERRKEGKRESACRLMRMPYKKVKLPVVLSNYRAA